MEQMRQIPFLLSTFRSLAPRSMLESRSAIPKTRQIFFPTIFSLRFVIRLALFAPVRKSFAGLKISAKTRAKLRRHANTKRSENRKWMFSARARAIFHPPFRSSIPDHLSQRISNS